MKKIIKLILAVLLTVTAAGCSKRSGNGEKETIKTVPAGFYRNYEQADFDRYNSHASENGLGGTYIWVEGSFSEINTIESEGLHIMHATFTDTEDNKWLLLLDIEEMTSRYSFEKLFNHTILITGQYDGFSDVYSMPVVYLISLYDRNTGNIVSSVAFADLKQETEPSGNNTQPQLEPEPEPEPAKEETNAIRPDVKEALDTYESFINEYVDFMIKYQESDNSIALLADYMSFMRRYELNESKLDALEKDLNDAELVYFYEIVNRCNLKLLQLMN